MSVFSLSAALLASTLAAEPTALFIPQAINLDPTEAQTYGAVCAAELGRATQGEVLAPSSTAAAIGPNGSLVEAAQSLHASSLVELTLVSLGAKGHPGRVLMNAVLRGLDGKELYRADTTAESLDDSPLACQRLALALTRRVPVSQTLDRTNVTAAEAKASRKHNRVGSEHVIGVKFGFGEPLAQGGQLNPIGTLMFDLRFEKDRYFIEAGLGALLPAVTNTTNTTYGGFTAELGASYYLTTGDAGVYVGAGVQPRLIFSGSIFNLAPYAQLGVMLNREANPRLYLDVRVAQNLMPVGSPYSGTTSLYPTELTAQVGIGW